MIPEVLSLKMETIRQQARWRRLRPRSGIDFTSNDYLSLASDPLVKARVIERARHHGLALSSSGSRLLRGNHSAHEELETELARFSSRESALYFPSGYQANLGLISALVSRGDTVFSDEFNHASIIDGIKLAGATKRIYRHLNTADLRHQLQAHDDLGGSRNSGTSRWIITESLFSMDGDLAPLEDLANLAIEFDAHLLVDEAHSTALWNEGGLTQHLGLNDRVLATMHSAGKGLGSSGAWIACDEPLRDYLINTCRPFLFSTAPSPLSAIALSESLRRWQEVGADRIAMLRKKSAHFRTQLDLPVLGPIFPVVVGDRATDLATQLQEMGFDVRAIRPPSVPEGTSRLRITLNAASPDSEIEGLLSALTSALRVV